MKTKKQMWADLKKRGLVIKDGKAKKPNGSWANYNDWRSKELYEYLKTDPKPEEQPNIPKPAPTPNPIPVSAPGIPVDPSTIMGQKYKGVLDEGSELPIWDQLDEKKNKFIGGLLVDLGDINLRGMGIGGLEKRTEIKSFQNGKDDFFVIGKDFKMGGNKAELYVEKGLKKFLTIRGRAGLEFQIHPKE